MSLYAVVMYVLIGLQVVLVSRLMLVLSFGGRGRPIKEEIRASLVPVAVLQFCIFVAMQFS